MFNNLYHSFQCLQLLYQDKAPSLKNSMEFRAEMFL